MPYVLVRHKVTDYDQWKPVYDDPEGTRRAGGSRGARLFRNANDPSEIVALFEWESLEKAQQWAQSDTLREKMQRAGVADHPDIYFLEQVEETPT